MKSFWSDVKYDGGMLFTTPLPQGEILDSLDKKAQILDFGCGYGYIAANLARHRPAITKIDAYDADARAVTLAQRNGGEKVHAVWQDIRKLFAPSRYDVIVMNPPFHEGKQADASLGQRFIEASADGLVIGGRLLMVANRQLPYELALKRAFRRFHVVAQTGLYKVIEAVR